MSYTTPPHKKARIIRRSLNGGTENTPMNTMATLPPEVPTNPPLEKKRIYRLNTIGLTLLRRIEQLTS